MINQLRLSALSALLAAGAMVSPATAQVKVGVTASLTGPAAALGIGALNAIKMMPTKIGDITVEFIVLDDASDTTGAVVNAKKHISENKVDLIFGPSTTPQSLAVLDVAAEAKVPLIANGSSRRIIEPVDEKRRWAFKTTPNDDVWLRLEVDHMVKKGMKKLAFFGASDAFGDSFLAEIQRLTKDKGIEIVAVERFNPRDTNATAQALKIAALKPDAVLVVASGVPATLPPIALKQAGYNGVIFQTGGAVSPDYIRVGGASVDGTIVSVGPCMVAEQLDATHPMKEMCMDFVARYEKEYGKGSSNPFATQAYDGWRIMAQTLPLALKTGAKPGTPEFRVAWRDAIESGVKNLHGNTGYFNFTPQDHSGLDERGQVLLQLVKGKWTLMK